MTKRIHALKLVALLLCTALLLCACQKPAAPTTTEALSKTAMYQVTVLGVDGKPTTDGVIIRFLRNGEEIAMQKTDASGVASKELDRGDYTVEIMFIDQSTSYYYDTTNLTLSATKTELTVELAYKAENPTKLFYGAEEDEYHVAYELNTGRTNVPLEAGKRSYFLFAPAESGIYRMSVEGGAYTVGYYGSPFFIQQQNVGTVEGDAVIVSVSPDMIGTSNTGTTVLVIGVDNPENAEANAMLRIERVGAYVDTSIPSQDYKTTGSLAPWTLPAGTVTSAFDLTADTDAYKLVLDEATGFYHLGTVDGPLVLVCLGEEADDLLRYAASFDTVLQTVGVKKYFTDENGNYTHKEDYGPCLLDYIGLRDYATGKYTGGCVDRASGLYPLTNDLMYIIQQHGDYAGWWDISSNGYLFKDANNANDPSINAQIAWLFMCVYVQA